jgi:hypothetical protein
MKERQFILMYDFEEPVVFIHEDAARQYFEETREAADGRNDGYCCTIILTKEKGNYTSEVVEYEPQPAEKSDYEEHNTHWGL